MKAPQSKKIVMSLLLLAIGLLPGNVFSAGCSSSNDVVFEEFQTLQQAVKSYDACVEGIVSSASPKEQFKGDLDFSPCLGMEGDIVDQAAEFLGADLSEELLDELKKIMREDDYPSYVELKSKKVESSQK